MSDQEPIAAEAQILGSPAARAANAALIALSRTARSLVLSDAESEAVRASVPDLREKMFAAVRAADPLRLDIGAFEIALGPEVVYLERDRDRSLAFQMFDGGVRRLVIAANVTGEEVLRLAEILSASYDPARQADGDLVTRLRNAQLAHVTVESETAAPAPAPPSAGVDVVPPIELGGSRRQLFEGVLPEVLREIYVGGKTGVLHLTRGDERRSIRFWKGHIVYAQSNVTTEHMGEIAVREGKLSAADLARATDLVVRENKRLGTALEMLGIMTGEQIEDLVAMHAREVLVKAFPWKDGSYDFERQAASASWFEEMALRLSTPDIILEAVRRIEMDDVVRFHLGDLDRVLALSEASKTPVRTLTPLDSFVMSRVDGTSTAREVIAIVPFPTRDVQRSLFGLLCTGLVQHQKR
jgi:hypothetical protein